MNEISTPGLIIRPENANDVIGIRRVNEAAFERPDEANLVDALRPVARPYISLVAEIEGQIVGHVLFTPVTVESESEIFVALGLAPVAVLPDFQNQGIGSALIVRGLQVGRDAGYPLVFVLGHPGYYPRFGFETASRKGFKCLYPAPDEAFMVAELKPESAAGKSGTVRFLPQFDAI